jgi:hypothetical protein
VGLGISKTENLALKELRAREIRERMGTKDEIKGK